MRSPLGIALLVIGVLMLAFGLYATDSLSSSFSELFRGTPDDRSIFIIIGGAGALVAGLVMTALPRRSH